jgi:hypothetical protein
MSGVFGSAVALAGAFVAIKLASHALQLQKEQQVRENVQSHFQMINVISENLEEATRSITDMIRSIQAIYSTAVTCEHLIIEFGEKHIPSGKFSDVARFAQNLSPDMCKEIETIRTRGTKRMEELMLDIAAKCRDNPAMTNPISAFLLKKIGGEKFPFYSSDHMTSLSEMNLWAHVFQINADTLHKVNQYEPKQYIEYAIAARVSTNLFVNAQGDQFNDASLRGFLMIGALCEFNFDLVKMIFEINEHLPHSDKIVAALKLLLPKNMEMSEGIFQVLSNFNLHANIDSSLQYAFAAYRTHQPRLPAVQ